MRNLWASFDFLVHFLIIFFIVQSFKNEILSKILDIQKYNIVRHWFSSKNWIFAIFFKKVSIDGFTHFYRKYTPNIQKIYFSKVSNILYIFIRKCSFQQSNIVRHWFSSKNWYDIDFPQKIGFFFLRKFLLTVLHIFDRKYTPNFQKIDFSIYPNILYICDQNFMLVPTIKLLEFSDKNWETYERLLIFWSIFWLFFLLSKVSKMKFHQKSLIHKNTTLYDIDFPQKIGFFRFFLRKFLLTVLHIFDRKYTPNFQKIDFSIYPNILYICDQNFMLVPTIKLLEFSDKNWETYERLLIFWSIFWLFFLLSKVSKMKFHQKSLIHKNTTLYDIDFPQKIGFLRFFLRKFLLTENTPQIFKKSTFWTHYLWKILLIFIVQSFKNEISSKILDTQKYNIVRHWFSSKNWIFAIFFKKVSIDGFTHFWSKIHPKFSKNRLFHIPQYIIYLWSEFYARSNNQTIRIFG